MNPDNILQKYRSRFQGQPVIVRSPGRINLIGEHTDYNKGFVLPAAIDLEIILAVGKNNTSICTIHSLDLNQDFQFALDSLQHTDLGWPNYLIGVVQQLQRKGIEIGGFNCVFGGNIPLGSGMSSSAALECGLAFALNDIFALNLDRLSMIKLSQQAENEFVGVKCGIMDQFASMMGKNNQVIQLDCRSLDYQYFPFDTQSYKLVMCNSGVSHSLASSEYNTRRQQCEKGVSMLNKYHPEVKSLRDVSFSLLEEHQHEMDAIIYRRCKYVLEENQRVERGCQDLAEGNIKAFGEKMYQSHEGLKNDYEVSCKELDFLVEKTVGNDAVLGARMMGGGFGGCTINLLKSEALVPFTQEMKEQYQQGMGINLEVYSASISEGTSIIQKGKAATVII